MEFLACATEVGADHEESNCDTDACAAVESGLYKTERQLELAPRPVVNSAFILATLLDLSTPYSAANPLLPKAIPPELSQTWHFMLRAALPPRAPSCLS